MKNRIVSFSATFRITSILMAALALVFCARIRPPAVSPLGKEEIRETQIGIASWYGPGFHGRLTSNREVYDMNEMTAAHKTLPFGTNVLVTNLTNGKAARVRINDRGPFVGDRLIDLSYAAARTIDIVVPGTAPVRLDILKDHSPPPNSVRYAVQVGSFAREENARVLEARLQRTFARVSVSRYEISGATFYRVRVKASGRAQVDRIAADLARDGFKSLIVEED
jgi:rare lipoprotein A